MSKTLIFRADANTQMGTGHVMRCIALGQAWKDAGGSVLFVTHCDNGGIIQRVSEEGFDWVELSCSYPETDEDIATTLAVANQHGAEWIVADGYHFDLEYQQSVRRAGFKLLYVDDYNHLPEYEADILLNQNMGVDEMNYSCNSGCTKLLGANYVMLRREFRLAERKERAGPVRNILITMGGSDPDNASRKVIEALLHSNISDLHVKVVVGPTNPHVESLAQAASEAVLNVELVCSVRDMPSLIQWADFAVSAAGSTCWELAAMKVPFITVILAENQKQAAMNLEMNNDVPCMGWPDASLEGRLRDCFLKYFSRGAVNPLPECRLMVDCSGCDRILRRLAVK